MRIILSGSEAKGNALVFSFTLISAFQAVYIAGLLHGANVFAMLFLVFLVVSVVSLCSVFKQWCDFYKQIKENLFSILLVNFTTLVSFLGYFIALKYIEPAIYSVVATSIGPVITLFITVVMLKYERAKKTDILSCSGIIVSMVFLVYAIYSGRSAVGSISLPNFVNGLFMTFISGCAMTINNIWSGRLNKRGVRPEYILTSRFILLIVFSFFAAGPGPVVTTAKEYGISIALIALLGNTFSLFLLQYGIKHTSSFSVAMILVCSPLFCLIFQGIDHQFAFSLYSTIGILSCSLFVLIGIWGKKRKTMPKGSLN